MLTMAKKAHSKSTKRVSLKDAAFSPAELKALKGLSERQRETAAKSDPDAQPLDAAMLRQLTLAARIKQVRKNLGLGQGDFAKRYKIPLGTLRDAEQGRTEGSAVMAAYVAVIARDPKGAAKAVEEAA